MNSDTNLQSIQSFLEPWYKSFEGPEQAQEQVLRRLLAWYGKTQLGQKCKVSEISSLEEYRLAFPVVSHQDLLPELELVKKGKYTHLLPESPLEWGVTRGTTGQSKYIPLTQSDLRERTLCGPRGLLNFVVQQKKLEILQGFCLNLSFPSVLGTLRTDAGVEIPYGYSSGIYTRRNAEDARLKLIPTQDQVDALGGGLSRKDWEKRFQLAYEEAKHENVSMLIGVTQIMLQFGKFLKKKIDHYPKDVWNISFLGCTSIPGIQTKYLPALKALYGNQAAVVEMYGATEGLYAQQLDDKPYVVPNYDVYLFEVRTRKEIKMLYQMKRGEYGSLIISSILFPRYEIGDIIKSFGHPYFRVLGRKQPLIHLRYLLGRILGYS